MGLVRKALQELRPNSRIAFYGDEESYEAIHWKDSNASKPTKEEFDAKIAELKPAWDKWAEDRSAAYPSVEEQLDLLWHTINSGQELKPGCSWFEMIRRAKESTPKP